jgi:predicted TIM-barrel enzyme
MTDEAAVTSGVSTSRIASVFGAARVLLPVVHPVTWEQALESVRTAEEVGVKGVFLINQGLPTDKVLELVLAVRQELPSLWVGVNLLGLKAPQALETALDGCDGRLDGLWNDDAGIDESAAAQPEAEAFLEARRRRGWTGLYFGGVAFKYRREVPPALFGQAAATAAPYMDVICTSGPGTGQAAEVAKPAAMRAALAPGVALALASGVTEDNVETYLPYVDAYLVGTGLEAELGVLDPARVRRLQRLIAGYRPTASAV